VIVRKYPLSFPIFPPLPQFSQSHLSKKVPLLYLQILHLRNQIRLAKQLNERQELTWGEYIRVKRPNYLAGSAFSAGDLTSTLQKFPKTDMGEPVGRASGRTFRARSTYVPDPCWSSPLVRSSVSLKMSIRPPYEALKSGLPMAGSATVR
jgi:hypothetical protein